MATGARNVVTGLQSGSNRQIHEVTEVQVPGGGSGRKLGWIGILQETVAVTQFTDGGAAAGTYQMVGSVPAGALILGTKIGPVTGFAGDTSATLVIGDGSDADRYMTGTPSVFTTNAVGIECGIVSGTKLLTADNRPTLTVTTNADFTAAVSNGSGVVTVTIYYMEV